MGRRAKKAPVVTKKRPKLAKRFKCPFCANDDVVECKMDFKAGIGSLSCRLCGAAYQMPIHSLHEPVDVFSEWLDDCEAAAHPSSTRPETYDNDDDDDEDDELPPSSGMGTTKAPATKKPAANNATAANTYTDLGLDDSDDDDDEDD